MKWLSQKLELNRGGPAENTRPMEGMRGLAVFLVFLVHFCTLAEPYAPKASLTSLMGSMLHTLGNTGVDLFFVLSGYLIYASILSRAQPIGRFIARRIERIYPTFLVVFLTYCALSWIFPAESKIPNGTWPAAVYLAANLLLLPGLFPIEPLITVAWSLSYEMLYYLVIPILVGLGGMRAWPDQTRLSFFVILATTIFSVCALWGGHVRLNMFIAGILLHEIMKSGKIRALPDSWAACLSVAGILASLLPISGSAAMSLKTLLMFLGFLAICHACFSRLDGVLARFFSTTGVRWLGNISYSYYLIHGLCLKAGFMMLDKFFPSLPPSSLFYWGLMPAMFALTVLVSLVLFLTIERPLSLRPG